MHPLAYLVLTIGALLTLVPFLWMVSTAFKTRPEVFSQTIQWIPNKLMFSNFIEAWNAAPFGVYYKNTILVVVSLVIVQTITTTLAAYAFARMRFRWNNFLFFLFLVQLMITPQATVLPNYFTMSTLNLINTRTAIILPYFASAFGTFLLRQAFRTIPQELEDAALIDGCGSIGFLRYVGIPLVKPTILTFVIISVTYHWNEFFWPFIVTESNRVRTLTVGLAVLAEASESGAEWTLLMAATLIVIVPLIILFVIFQRRFIESFMQAGIKG
jgi:sn-glycerol 3-phosphate transport system permease protein